MALTFTLTGIPQAQRKIAELAAVSGMPILRAALTAGALPISNAWKEGAAYDTGTYRRSIHIGGITQPEGGDPPGRKIGRKPLPGPDEAEGKVTIYVGTDIVDPPYPYFLEVGTSRMGAQPAALPAFDSRKDEAVVEVAAVLRELTRHLII